MLKMNSNEKNKIMIQSGGLGDHIPHLHVHLAPHFDGDNYADDVIKSCINIKEDVMTDGEQRNLGGEIKRQLWSLL